MTSAFSSVASVFLPWLSGLDLNALREAGRPKETTSRDLVKVLARESEGMGFSALMKASGLSESRDYFTAATERIARETAQTDFVCSMTCVEHSSAVAVIALSTAPRCGVSAEVGSVTTSNNVQNSFGGFGPSGQTRATSNPLKGGWTFPFWTLGGFGRRGHGQIMDVGREVLDPPSPKATAGKREEFSMNTHTQPVAGFRVRFENVGACKRSWEATLKHIDFDSLYREVKKRGGIMSRGIEFCTDDDEQKGSIFVGVFRCVGTFSWAPVE